MMKALLARSSTGFFASQTLTGHLLRGGLALALWALAMRVQGERPVVAVVAALAALVALRGCPMCWTLGLIETAIERFRSPPSR